jgi:hypothetical protein
MRLAFVTDLHLSSSCSGYSKLAWFKEWLETINEDTLIVDAGDGELTWCWWNAWEK